MKALIVIDVQKGFITKERYVLLATKLNKFIEKTHYDKLFFVQFKNDRTKNTLFQTTLGWDRLVTEEEQEFAVTIPKNATIFEKYGYGLQQKDLDFVKSLNLTTIDICGLKTEACVYTIALQLFDLGISPNILFNYVEGDKSLKPAMKKLFIQQFGAIDERE